MSYLNELESFTVTEKVLNNMKNHKQELEYLKAKRNLLVQQISEFNIPSDVVEKICDYVYKSVKNGLKKRLVIRKLSKKTNIKIETIKGVLYYDSLCKELDKVNQNIKEVQSLVRE